MKAITIRRYGPPGVLKLEDIEKPVPKNNEILVRVRATAVTSGDARIRGLNVPFGFKFITQLMFGFQKPKKPVLGVVMAGTIETIGKDVKTFKEGDAVFGASKNFGCHAEYVAIGESDAITLKPGTIDFDEAASIPFGALTSLKYLRDFGKIKRGQKVLINGASGALGVYGVQLAKYFGAEVTAICSTSNLELVKSLGADKAIDYTTTDFAKNGDTYDIIYDTVGKISFSHCKGSLKEKGRLLLAAAGMPQYFQVLLSSITGGKKVVAGVAIFGKKDLNIVNEIIKSGSIKPVIGKRFPLEKMAEAHAYVDTGHKIGSAVITL